MTKYTPQQLRGMALVLREAKQRNDPRYRDFLFQVAVRSGTSITFIEQKIQDYINSRGNPHGPFRSV